MFLHNENYQIYLFILCSRMDSKSFDCDIKDFFAAYACTNFLTKDLFTAVFTFLLGIAI